MIKDKVVKWLLRKLIKNPIYIGVVSLIWLLYRSGTKPTRVVYPCQRASAVISFHILIYPILAFLTGMLSKLLAPITRKQRASGRKILSILLLSTAIVLTGLAIYANLIINPISIIQSRTILTGNKTKVSVVRVNNNLQTALEEALNYIGGIEQYVPRNSKVLIKPNIVRNQEPPDTTDPAIVEALINIIKRRNPSVIWIADGSGEQNTIENFKTLGYLPVAERTGAVLVDLNFGEMVWVPVPGGGVVFDSFLFNSIVTEADVFISLACMKTHYQAVVTLTMKNLIGIAPGSIYGYPPSPTKVILHEEAQKKGDDYMAGVIVDLCSARKINLAIIDGRVAMEGQGPHWGDPVNLNVLIVGSDPVATDTVASMIMGFDPEKVPTLKLANQMGLGTNNLHEIEIKGEKIEDIYKQFKPAEGHEKFQILTATESKIYKMRDILIYSSVISWVAVASTIKFLKLKETTYKKY
ncbi:DUF362 domain-containing protein [Candidatus Bathyarchaeota archaeon]|nr:DUF362 domain-containing protein [Candidatus Bathyarchaeota archaeon]